VVEEDFPCLPEFVALHIELVEEVGVEGYVEERLKGVWVAFLAAAALGAGGPPFARDRAVNTPFWIISNDQKHEIGRRLLTARALMFLEISFK